jgi:hypothetical protein
MPTAIWNVTVFSGPTPRSYSSHPSADLSPGYTVVEGDHRQMCVYSIWMAFVSRQLVDWLLLDTWCKTQLGFDDL